MPYMSFGGRKWNSEPQIGRPKRDRASVKAGRKARKAMR